MWCLKEKKNPPPSLLVPLFLPPSFATSFFPHPTLLLYQHKLKGGLCPEAAVWEGKSEPAQGESHRWRWKLGELHPAELHVSDFNFDY